MAETARSHESKRSAGGIWHRVWKRLCRYSFTKRRISRKSLELFCREMATEEYTLVAHSSGRRSQEVLSQLVRHRQT